MFERWICFIKRMGNLDSKPDAVIAIEIGNVNSGFAYSFEHNKDRIYTGRHGCVLPMDRVPTILMLDKEGKFDSFGIVARERYMSLSLQEEHKSYSYFNSLDVVPSDQNTEYIVKDSEGKSVNAKQVYAIIISYLYGLAIANIPNNEENPKRVCVVITISSGSSDFMWDIIHAAANYSGINEENLKVLFNCDAAVLYCSKQNLLVDKNLASSHIKKNFILMNLGGRRTEILATRFAGKTHILHCGGESVTELFCTTISSMKSKSEWSNFQHACIYDYECIKLNFEKLKHKFDGTGKFILEIPETFCKLPENNEGDQSIILKDIVFASDNKIVLTKEAIEQLFDPTIEQIVNELKGIQMTTGKGGEKTAILMTGGFSESSYVRKIICKEMKPSKVLLVPNASLDVLKGAVLIGYENVRRSKYSYGLIHRFTSSNQSIHVPHDNEVPGGSEQFKFRKLFEKQEMLKNEREKVETIFVDINNTLAPILLYLHKTEKTNIEIVSHQNTDTEIAGRVKIKPPHVTGWGKKQISLQLRIIVKEKGFRLILRHKETNQTGEAEILY